MRHPTVLRSGRFAPLAAIVALLATAACARPDQPAEPLGRQTQLRTDARAIEKCIRDVGSWEDCGRLLQPWRKALAERLANAPKPKRGRKFIANDAPLRGEDGFLISARRATQLTFDADPCSTDKVGLERLESFYRTAVAMHRQLAAEGIDLLVVPVPDKSDVYPQYLAELPDGASTVMLCSKRVYLQLLRAGVEVVDLEPLFRKEALKKDAPPLYMKRDTHWSPRASKLAADEIGRRLRRYDFITPRETPRYGIDGQPMVQWLGDLEKNWRAAGRKAHGVERYPFPAVKARRGKTGRDRNAAVQVLGDSYAVFPYNNSQTFWAYLTASLQQPVGVEDRAGGASALAKRLWDLSATRNKKTRVVVWLFTNCSLYEQGFQPPKPTRGRGKPGDDSRQVTLRVELSADAPAIDPDTLDYPNALLTLPAKVTAVKRGKLDGKSVLLVFRAVKSRRKTPAASLRKGDRLEGTVRFATPPDQAAWMMIDNTDAFDLHPRYVQQWEKLGAE